MFAKSGPTIQLTFSRGLRITDGALDLNSTGKTTTALTIRTTASGFQSLSIGQSIEQEGDETQTNTTQYLEYLDLVRKYRKRMENLEMTTITTISCATPSADGASISDMAAKLDEPKSSVMAEAKAQTVVGRGTEDAKSNIAKIKAAAQKMSDGIPGFLARPPQTKEEQEATLKKNKATTTERVVTMPKGKKSTPHAADAHDTAQITSAKEFITSLFVNSAFDKLSAKTLEEARANVVKLQEAHPKATRKPLVYAVLPDGNQVLVAANYDPSKTNGMKAAGTKAATGKLPKSGISGRAQWTQAEEAAKNGTVPPPPDFSANTHKSYRKHLEAVVAMVTAKDIDGLKKWKPSRTDGSPAMIDRYRRIALTALQAKAKK